MRGCRLVGTSRLNRSSAFIGATRFRLVADVSSENPAPVRPLLEQVPGATVTQSERRLHVASTTDLVSEVGVRCGASGSTALRSAVRTDLFSSRALDPGLASSSCFFSDRVLGSVSCLANREK